MTERHVLALSGGKDSAALAVYMRDKYPDLDLEYVFTDSGCELPETYAYLDRIRAMLNIEITVIRPEKDFDYWLKYYNGVLPSPNNRWCTRQLKLRPFEEYLGTDLVYSYVAIRADESRTGYRNKKGNIIPRYPFIESQIMLENVIDILRTSGLGLPAYYAWRTRSGCYFCFYQSDQEWLGLRKHHPQEFEKACRYEENHSDGRTYTWRRKKAGKPLFLRNIDDSKAQGEMEPHPHAASKKLIQLLADVDFDSEGIGGLLRTE